MIKEQTYLDRESKVAIEQNKRVHLIAVGGSIMHNLAIALALQGYKVTGSDDKIYDPARTNLDRHGLLPEQEGWFPDKITPDIDAIILGMHAQIDNPELQKALHLKIPVYSFPAFIYDRSRHKQRIVITGSHGKTTITSMIIHVLKNLGCEFDYAVGASVSGLEHSVKLSESANYIIIEGDEYFASRLEMKPKFLVYDPHVVVVSGISWDHINVFPTLREYEAQFEKLFASLTKAGMCVYNKEDKTVKNLATQYLKKEYHFAYPYGTPPYRINRNNVVELKLEGKRFPVQVIGKHNASNIAAAWQVCQLLAVQIDEFIQHIKTYKGAGMRLETVYEDAHNIIIRDFAHAPSKVNASVQAVSEFYKDRNIIVCLELHTFSSLNKEYLKEYKNTLKKVKNKIIYINPDTIEHKKLPPISENEIHKAFNDSAIKFVGDEKAFRTNIKEMLKAKNVILLMSSGNFNGFDWRQLL